MGWAERKNINSQYNKKRIGLRILVPERKLPDVIINQFTFKDWVNVFFIYIKKILRGKQHGQKKEV